uniref:uncharacterized protein LOC122587680 n=1 Tax=Erigeron canadensis TaxID=72917 RepID=UPI001CB9036F|nr:uncharacterized protein LOC122587680 [Erigeron canadensis]
MTMLPSFFVLQSGGKYLSLTDHTAATSPQAGFLKFDGQEIFCPRVRFAVEASETTGLVHIRSCYNNKYLVTKQIDNNLLIVACAKKPEEDVSKDSSTHLLGDDDTQQDMLVVSSTGSVFNAIDWNSLVIIPSNTQVAFRSEQLTDSYLISVVLDRWYPYQKFERGWDIGDPLVAKELIQLGNGDYRVNDMHFRKRWTGAPGWIWAEAAINDTSNNTRFAFVKVSDKIVALRHVNRNQFCGIITMEGKVDVLRASYPTISRQARLMVEECVLSREITNVIYRLSDSRIYGENIEEVNHAMATNNSATHDSTISLAYTITDARTTSWTNSVSISMGVQVSFKTSVIPLIASGKVEVSTEFGYTYEWGVSETRERTRTTTYNVVVPPLTSIKVTLMCTKGACDVPFTYTQRDLRTNGTWVSTVKHDGVYTGANAYNFYYESTEVPLN